jgi:predicted GIY-YIG superfamily endonuclease
VQLAKVITVPDRSAALREEARIKRLPRADKLKLVEDHQTSGRARTIR